jgi:hypothetical protein
MGKVNVNDYDLDEVLEGAENLDPSVKRMLEPALNRTMRIQKQNAIKKFKPKKERD